MSKQEQCDPRQIMLRRKQYGQAVREHMNRPHTADDYLGKQCYSSLITSCGAVAA